MENKTAIGTIASFLLTNDDSESSDNECIEYEEISSSFWDDELETLTAIIMVKETRGEVVPIEKLNGYVERVIPSYSRITFKEHFRMFPETFQVILQTIAPLLRAINNRYAGKETIPEEKQLLIAIWFMATPDSYRSIATKFGVGKATAFRALRRVTYALYYFAPNFIKWPQNQDAENVQLRFQRSCHFPKIIGAIDGTHIKIRAPVIDAYSYVNRKGFHSINLQVVCDSNGRFTHCYAGQPGSVHDARVFRRSRVAQFLEMPEQYFPNDCHIIGDAAYSIHPHMMVPFRNNGHLSMRQKNFNFCLSSTRMAVERAIGELKIRFRILLDCLPLTDIYKIPEFIVACCVLHNICKIQNDEVVCGVVCRDHDQNHIEYGNATHVGNEKNSNYE